MSGVRAELRQMDVKRLKLRDQNCLNCNFSEDLQGNRVFCRDARKRIGIKGWCLRWE